MTDREMIIAHRRQMLAENPEMYYRMVDREIEGDSK